MDSELEQVLCNVLSLEEDYPSMSPPPRFQDCLSSTPCVSPDGLFGTERQSDLQVLCNVLSLSEDYPSMSPPPRFQDCLSSTPCVSPDGFFGTERQTDLQDSPNLQEKLMEIYSLFKKSKNPMEPAYKGTVIEYPLKRKYVEDESEGSDDSGVKIDDFQNGNSNKRCRKRTSYTKDQTAILMKEFDGNPYPDFTSRCRIAKITGISEPRIQVWFQNRRARHLSKHMKSRNVQSRQFPATGDHPNMFPKESQHLQLYGHFQIPENMWIV